jgi:tetratricopeptide (TPR) repeat protein
MKNVAQIQTIAESGDLGSAHEALDALLEMGPRNVEALKLRARLYEVSGQFQQEAKIWDQIARIDREDNDLAEYIARRQHEDRENFYFTDAIPGGGKKFVAFPRQMVRAAASGLVGCVIFLIIARLAGVWPILNHPAVMLSSFAFLVISPWFAIVSSYAKSLRYVCVTKEGIEIATRFKLHKLSWTQVENVFLAQDDRQETYQLSLIVMAKDEAAFNLELDFNENTTPIRARSYFVREIMQSWGEPSYVSRRSIDLGHRATIKA